MRGGVDVLRDLVKHDLDEEVQQMADLLLEHYFDDEYEAMDEPAF